MRTRRRKSTTISDVADYAKVSVATVSRVLNNKANIKSDTKERVYQAIAELNYTVPATCGNAKKRLLLMITPKITNPFYSSIFDGATKTANKNGYQLLICQSSHDNLTMKDLESIILEEATAGIILLQRLSDETLTKLAAQYPVVQCCEYNENCDVSYVSVDDFLAAKNVMDYLISIGRSRFAMVNSTLNFNYARYREQGFLDALRQAKLPINENWVLHLPEISYDMAFSSVAQLLQQQERPDAIFAASDVFAAAAIKASQHIGLHVPKDIAVVGFDNLDICNIAAPSITSVNQPTSEMGMMACTLLIEKIKNPGNENQHLLMQTNLVVRGSTMS